VLTTKRDRINLKELGMQAKALVSCDIWFFFQPICFVTPRPDAEDGRRRKAQKSFRTRGIPFAKKIYRDGRLVRLMM
jgi:hypothetical protein